MRRRVCVGAAPRGAWPRLRHRHRDALLTAFVIPPDDTLGLRRYRTIADAFRAGDLRRCRRSASVLECSVPARGFVRDAAGHIEIGIRDANWLRFALASRRPRILLVVKRDRQEVWSDEFPLVLPDRGT